MAQPVAAQSKRDRFAATLNGQTKAARRQRPVEQRPIVLVDAATAPQVVCLHYAQRGGDGAKAEPSILTLLTITRRV